MRFATLLLAAAGLASTVDAYWLGDIAREKYPMMPCCGLRELPANSHKDQGRAPFAPTANYPVFRNVRDYGARGS
jgi:glucan 1,3-beta-glucosidase